MADHSTDDGGVHAASAAAGHEVTDVDAGPLAKAGIALAVTVLIGFVCMLIMFRTLIYVQPLYEGTPDPHPLSATRALSTEPRLQPDPPRQKGELRRIEDHVLTTYDWVDKELGLARIPVERAIDLLANSGLPEKTGTGASVPEAATGTP